MAEKSIFCLFCFLHVIFDNGLEDDLFLPSLVAFESVIIFAGDMAYELMILTTKANRGDLCNGYSSFNNVIRLEPTHHPHRLAMGV